MNVPEVSAVPVVPFAGRMSYCLIRGIQMVLAYRGHDYPAAWLECVSGESFGFVYVRDGKDFFGIMGFAYHIAGEHLLRTLNFDYSYTDAPDDAAALAALDVALAEGPVVAGMLDMGYLSYMPDAQSLRGSDHAIVVLARRPDAVIVHDPAGYPTAVLPLADFLAAWQRDIYTGKPYGLWRIGAQREATSDEMIWTRTLARARENVSRTREAIPGGPSLLYGPEAMRTLAADLRDAPERPLGGLPYFNWRVSGQRCLDGAAFLRARLPEAAAIRWDQCVLFGQLQAATIANDRDAMAAALHRLADAEERFITALGPSSVA